MLFHLRFLLDVAINGFGDIKPSLIVQPPSRLLNEYDHLAACNWCAWTLESQRPGSEPLLPP
jgi:hypothetical protein